MVTQTATSPASSGPAGSHFEGQVGAYYLLSLLTRSEPRGLPGTSIDTVELQRAAEGRALDDVIVCAHNAAGVPAVLEIQVKRSISFTRTDPVFKKVVGQIVAAAVRDDFWTTRYELAVATAQSSRKIDGPYQDVLTWARQINDAATFIDRIARPGSANEDMRTFVETFRSHLQSFGAASDDEAVWRLLRRFQILIFDFTAPGSASEALARERAVTALHPEDIQRAGALWSALTELAIAAAASGGDRDRRVLLSDPKLQSFRLSGERRFANVRAAISEAADAALSGIRTSVGNVILTRHERVASVHVALDGGRYIEIRGDAGVGKSGLFKHYVQQQATEATVLVLSPNRVIPNGWLALRSVLGFDGTARDLLVDLAGNGGATLFLDNLDSFSETERMTVVDLVRAGENVPGFAVVATMRRDFGIDEPNWLPEEVLNALGRAEPIDVGELSDAEVDEIRHAAPTLAPILADDHPARSIVRNLFRLSRIATQTPDTPMPRTEVEMAKHWWRTADGNAGAGHRERARLLKALAAQAVVGTDPMDTSDSPAASVDALVASETLRDLGGDQVIFYHDVLREWAIASLFHRDRSLAAQWALDRPAPATLARAVELAARIALETDSNSAHWMALLEQMSVESAHKSWRRAVLLALVRSEIGTELLDRASALLLADSARLLCELIRLVIAVEVKPASTYFAEYGVDPSVFPASLNVPIGSTWVRLIGWLLKLGNNIPGAAIPSVVDLYLTWCSGMLGRDPLTPLLVKWFHHWLTQIEAQRDIDSWENRQALFGGTLDHDRFRALESDLRAAFLVFCDHAPELAAQYITAQGQRNYNEETVSSISKFRGRLAAAAPAELANLIGNAIISDDDDEDETSYRSRRKGPFTFLDHNFFPASPAQGPFFELLTESPQHGLALIRRLVDHAIAHYSNGLTGEYDTITVTIDGCERVFTWTQSFAWSRGNVNNNCVPSALMALEAWGHKRIESGETVEAVLADVIGPDNAHAAYLLVAIDLLLSHWPKSRAAAVPFLGCPELLCFDRERQLHDTIDLKDPVGLGIPGKEPLGPVSPKSLEERTSRRFSLEQLIAHYRNSDKPELRESLVDLLTQSATRLGAPGERSTFTDPALMVRYALNLLEPKNWEDVTLEGTDGQPEVVHRYVPPEDERQHLARLADLSELDLAHSNMQLSIGSALDDPTRSSPAFAEAAVKWAQGEVPAPSNDETDKEWMQEQAVFGAAMIAMRDGDTQLRAQHGDWARDVFAQALEVEDDPVYGIRSGLRYNPIAMAFAGLLYALKYRCEPSDIREILEIAARDSSAAAHGLGAATASLIEIDDRLPRAILRCALVACVRPERSWQLPDEEAARRAARFESQRQSAVEQELAWLTGDQPEPEWPDVPTKHAGRRRGTRLPGGDPRNVDADEAPKPPEQYFGHQAASIWLNNAKRGIDFTKEAWPQDFARKYAEWTATANGAELPDGADVHSTPGEWNIAYFDLLAHCLPCLSLQEIQELALTQISSLPDQSFFDVVALFVRSVDDVYFNEHGLDDRTAIAIRAALVDRMTKSSGWRRLHGKRSASIESHIGPAIAALFFNNHGFVQPASCYLLAKGIDRIDPFLPTLETLTKTGASLFVAMLTLNLLEVSRRVEHLPFFLTAVNAWLESFSEDTDFWVDHGVGRRVCEWIEHVRQAQPDAFDSTGSARSNVDRILAALVHVGIADAKRLEEVLAT